MVGQVPRRPPRRPQSLRRPAWAGEFYDAQRAPGKHHHAALRALGNPWLEVLWHCLTNGVHCDEAVHLANRNQALTALTPRSCLTLRSQIIKSPGITGDKGLTEDVSTLTVISPGKGAAFGDHLITGMGGNGHKLEENVDMIRLAATATALLVLVAVPACAGSGHTAGVSSSQLTPAQARKAFGSFLREFKQLQANRIGTSGGQLLTGPERAAQAFMHAPVGPSLTQLTGQRVYVPRLSGYPRWFVAVAQAASGRVARFVFLLVQSSRRTGWQEATELYDLRLPGGFPDVSQIAVDAGGYAAAVSAGDRSLAVPPVAVAAGFSRYYNAAASHVGRTPATAAYSSNFLPQALAGERAAPRYGWRMSDSLVPDSQPVYALRLSGGGAAVIFVTRETFGWQAVSTAAANRRAPQSAINIGAAPDPFILQGLHARPVRTGERLTYTILDEHLAIDPAGSGTVRDFMEGKVIAVARS